MYSFLGCSAPPYPWLPIYRSHPAIFYLSHSQVPSTYWKFCHVGGPAHTSPQAESCDYQWKNWVRDRLNHLDWVYSAFLPHWLSGRERPYPTNEAMGPEPKKLGLRPAFLRLSQCHTGWFAWIASHCTPLRVYVCMDCPHRTSLHLDTPCFGPTWLMSPYQVASLQASDANQYTTSYYRHSYHGFWCHALRSLSKKTAPSCHLVGF